MIWGQPIPKMFISITIAPSYTPLPVLTYLTASPNYTVNSLMARQLLDVVDTLSTQVSA